MTDSVRVGSYQADNVQEPKKDKMTEAVPAAPAAQADPVAQAIADEMARARAAVEWAALVQACAARGEE